MIGVVRLPKVPMSKGVRSVSPVASEILARGARSSSATDCAGAAGPLVQRAADRRGDGARGGDGARAHEWSQLASRARESFLRAFWSDSAGYLADVVSGGTRDLTLRPNQLYAVGLPHALIPRDKAGCVVETVRKHLLTPVGLRTLSPDDPAYHGRHTGDARERDEAYHQGTVWPFLMGIYFDSVIRLYGEQGKIEARAWLAAFERHLEEAGLGTVSEVFDGDAPRPSGAIAQAWSVAELLRIAERLGRIPVVRSDASADGGLGPLHLPACGEVGANVSPGCRDVHAERRSPTRRPQAKANADVDEGGSARGREDLRGIDEDGRPQPGWSERGNGSLRLHASAHELAPKGGTMDHPIVDERMSS